MKNSADQGGCYPPRPKAEVDNTLQDLQNSSCPTKAEFNNFSLLFIQNISPFLMEFRRFALFLLTKITISSPGFFRSTVE